MHSTIKHAYSRVGGFERDAAFERLARSGLEGRALLELAIGEGVSGRTAVVSSFGAESVVLLALVAAIDPGLPVLFLETDRHFPETLRYRDDVIEFLGLRDVRDITPSPAEAATQDPTGDLWWFDPDACCGLRKVRPLAGALSGFDSWITGRKRHQAATRRSLPAVEMDGDLIKINPLVDWDQRMLDDAAREWNLPRHPLVAKGYRSIGCAPCTRAVGSGEDDRAGRWAGSGKTECGIHKAG